MLFRKILAFMHRDIRERLSFRYQIAVEGAAILVQCWTFYFVAKFVDLNTPQTSDYFAFLLLGVAISGFQFSGLSSFSAAIHKEMGTGTLEAILMTPTDPLLSVFASAIYEMGKTALKLFAYLFAAHFFFKLEIPHFNLLLVIKAILVINASLWGFGLISAAHVLVHKQGDPIAYLLNGLTRLFSGIYFPLSVLPDWAEALANLLPMTHALRLMRGIFIEGKDYGNFAWPIVILAGMAAISLPAGIFAYRRALRRAKSEGSLTYSD